jgi:hypothetical protein
MAAIQAAVSAALRQQQPTAVHPEVDEGLQDDGVDPHPQALQSPRYSPARSPTGAGAGGVDLTA